MNLEQRNELQRKLFENEIMAISENKGHDYSSSDDAMFNLRLFGIAGIIVRLGDKFFRLKAFYDKGNFRVKDESLRDTMIDIANYAMLAILLMDEESQR